LIPRLVLLAVLLLQQPIHQSNGLKEYAELRLYCWHRNRFHEYHREKFIPKFEEFVELEERYFELLKVLDVSSHGRKVGDPKDALRDDMHDKAEEVLEEIERLEKEWRESMKRLEKMP
jgi:hypothetical protein